MAAETKFPTSKTVEEVFNDFKGRRAGLVKALTDDINDFYQQCDPEKENLCLYGLPNGTWEVKLPVEEVPSELPEPTLGINFARDGMHEPDWSVLVAVHSDSWLVSLSFYFAARLRFGQNERNQLFEMINELPTIFEVVSESRDRARHNGKQSKSSEKLATPKDEGESRGEGEEEEEEELEDDDEQGATCGACGDNYATDEFWICCDTCEKWFHGKCVKVTPAKAQHIKQYKCPNCSNKRPRV